MIQTVPDATQMRRYLESGLTQQQIADKWEEDSGNRCSRSAIGMAISRYGLKSSKPRPRYADMLPWKLNEEHRMATIARKLRLEQRRREGGKLSDYELEWVQAFINDLEQRDAVVHYNPKTAKGFWLVARDPERDAPGDLIRRP